ncbi:Peroxidase 19 [Dichanthelium oligosanthes]|uniref:Peroxidase n=1 Tax=Dichanthelium oligosanthes TaxID=888268 RepID=A0A1E5VW54_9POAL|nr:Peroxidase 19 [Dichanthelium oligosanthes]
MDYSSRGVRRPVLAVAALLLVGSLVVGTSRAREAQPLPVAAAAVGSRRAPERHGLSLDFYAKTCPAVDQIVANVTAARYRDFPAAGPAVLRLFHHDCFVEGCDASILIAPTANAGPAARAPPKVERDMEENRNLAQEAFDTVELAKAAVESKCPGIVSCADVLALAARDYVQQAGGPYYDVKKGRKDSKVSLAGKVSGSLPRANSTVDELLRVFAGKGLGAADLVALSGAHTVGFAHCVHVLGRIYDYRGTRRPDPLMDARLVKALRMSCPSSGGSARVVVPFDVSTPFRFDAAYYGNLQARLGLLGSDQALFLDARTRPLVQELAGNQTRFFQAFVASVDRMGSIRIKKGKKGEVRKVCSQHLLAV